MKYLWFNLICPGFKYIVIRAGRDGRINLYFSDGMGNAFSATEREDEKKEENLGIISIKKAPIFWPISKSFFYFISFYWCCWCCWCCWCLNIYIFWWFNIKNVYNDGMLTWQGFIKNKIKTTKGQWQKQRGT